MIEVDRKQFTRAVDLAATVVERRHTIPNLTTLKAHANGALRIEGSNLDTFTVAEIPCAGAKADFDFIIPEPRSVRKAVIAAGGETVKLQPAKEDRLNLTVGQLASTLGGFPAQDHPGAERINFEEFGADLGANELRQIQRITRAISTEETRYYLNGVCVKKVSDWLYRFAATDGHRLMIVDVPLPNAAGNLPDGMIITREWLGIAIAQFMRAKDGARLRFGHKAVPNTTGADLPLEPGGPRIEIGGMIDGIRFDLSGKLIDGNYPDYEKVIPTNCVHAARLPKARLVQAIHALSALTDEKRRAIKLTFAPGRITCELKSPILGDAQFEIEAEHDAPADLILGFNGQYLVDACLALNGDEVHLALPPQNGHPMIITDPCDTTFQCIIMPMRV